MLRTKTFFFLLLLCLCHHSIRASEQQFPDIDAAIKSRREAIESQDEYSKINTRIASIDKNSRHLLKTAHDYVALLAFNNSSYTPGQWRDLNDQFLRNNLRDFFEKKPSLKEMIALSHMGRDVDIQTEIKENGLGLVHNAADYLALITTDVDTMRHLIKPEEESSKIKKFINFISSSLKTFKATRPSLDDVVSLKN
ncbi:MAG TPA: hypothetical protein VEL47_02105, partial [Myxococcota bacterium]|nr:hypothetical protein [Myxococcota bacterium]